MSELALDLYNALSEIGKLRKRIAELEALVNVSEGLYERIYEQAARIAELEGKIASLKDKRYEMANELEGKRFFTDTLFYDIYRLQSRIAELEAEIDQLTAHDATERQDDKSPNDTQTQTFVYGKEREE
jgi:predicted nuclease with TOPRIM domain